MKSSSFALTLGGLAAQAIYNQFTGGQRAAAVTRQLPSQAIMAYSKPRRTARRTRRPPMRRMRLTRPPPQNMVMPMVRHTGIYSNTLVAGTQQLYFDNILANVYTTDLIASYEAYRMKRVTLILTPQIDQGNSGIVNNYNTHIYACNDPTGDPTTLSNTQICSYSNYKYGLCLAGKSFYYSYFPKVLNSVDQNGTATGVGNYGKFNPWINLDTAGVNIVHKRLIFNINASATSTVVYNYVFKIEFDVMRRR